MPYVNDRWYVPGGEALETELEPKARKNSVEFFQTGTLVNASGFKSHNNFVVNALPSILKEE